MHLFFRTNQKMFLVNVEQNYIPHICANSPSDLKKMVHPNQHSTNWITIHKFQELQIEFQVNSKVDREQSGLAEKATGFSAQSSAIPI